MKHVFSKLILIFIFMSSVSAQVLGVRRAEEILSTLEMLTNTSRLEARVKAFYHSVNLSLPQTGKIEEYNASAILANIGLSSYFCLSMIEKDMTLAAADSWAHRTTDIKKDVSLWDERDVENLLVEYAEIFWGRVIDEQELVILNSIFNSYRKGSPNLKSVTTLVGVCSFMLSTPYVLIK